MTTAAATVVLRQYLADKPSLAPRLRDALEQVLEAVEGHDADFAEALEVVMTAEQFIAKLRPAMLVQYVTDPYFGDLTSEGDKLKAEFDGALDPIRALIAKHGGGAPDVAALRTRCAASGLHDHDGCTCSDAELLRRAKHGGSK